MGVHFRQNTQLVNAREVLVEAREKIKSDRKMETDSQYANGHNSEWSTLHNRSGNSAQTFFRGFVQRTEEDHAVKSALEIN